MLLFPDKHASSDAMIHQKVNYFIFLYIKHFAEAITKLLVKHLLYAFSDTSTLIFTLYMYLSRYIVPGVLEEKRSGSTVQMGPD